MRPRSASAQIVAETIGRTVELGSRAATPRWSARPQWRLPIGPQGMALPLGRPMATALGLVRARASPRSSGRPRVLRLGARLRHERARTPGDGGADRVPAPAADAAPPAGAVAPRALAAGVGKHSRPSGTGPRPAAGRSATAGACRATSSRRTTLPISSQPPRSVGAPAQRPARGRPRLDPRSHRTVSSPRPPRSR